MGEIEEERRNGGQVLHYQYSGIGDSQVIMLLAEKQRGIYRLSGSSTIGSTHGPMDGVHILTEG
jgi:hypothetical protein